MADRQGFLVKEGDKFKTWKKRWCVLKSGTMMYLKKQNGSELGIINVSSIITIRVSQYKNKKHCFELCTPGRTYFMCANDDADREGWVDALNAAKKRLEAGTKKNLASSTGVASANEEDKISMKDFDLKYVIGKGSFGKVMQVQKKDNGKIYAMKVLNKKAIMDKGELVHTLAEKRILQGLVHPFLVNLIYAFQTKDQLFFVMDYIDGGELFFHLQKEEKFSNERTRFYCAEIICGLEYLHNSGVLYRDLKPENILLTGDGHICMTDFGISKEGLVSESDRTGTFCGTPEYLAPEILQGLKYGKAVDWWSFGTLMYEMLTGLPPFYSQDVQEMYNKIMNDKLVFPPQMSEEAKSLLIALLERNPDKRLQDAKNIKAHPYFAGIDWGKIARKEVDPPFLPDTSGGAETPKNFDPDFINETPTVAVDRDEAITSSTFQDNFVGFTYVNTGGHLA